MITDYIEYAVELAKKRKTKEKEIIDKNQEIIQPIVEGIKQWHGINNIKVTEDVQAKLFNISLGEKMGVMVFVLNPETNNLKISAYNYGVREEHRFDTGEIRYPTVDQILRPIAEFISTTM